MRRKTVQKDAIKNAFLMESRPLRVDEILQMGRKVVKSLSQATVYRNLKCLVEIGWLRIINHPDLGIFYERAGKEHHHYFHCHACDRLFEIPGCALHEKEFVPPGFVTERHQVFLFGICSACGRT